MLLKLKADCTVAGYTYTKFNRLRGLVRADAARPLGSNYGAVARITLVRILQSAGPAKVV